MADFKTQTIEIDGMHCDACVRRVTQALGSVPGVRVVSVGIGKAEVVGEPPTEAAIRSAIDATGFTVKGVHAHG